MIEILKRMKMIQLREFPQDRKILKYCKSSNVGSLRDQRMPPHIISRHLFWESAILVWVVLTLSSFA